MIVSSSTSPQLVIPEKYQQLFRETHEKCVAQYSDLCTDKVFYNFADLALSFLECVDKEERKDRFGISLEQVERGLLYSRYDAAKEGLKNAGCVLEVDWISSTASTDSESLRIITQYEEKVSQLKRVKSKTGRPGETILLTGLALQKVVGNIGPRKKAMKQMARLFFDEIMRQYKHLATGLQRMKESARSGELRVSFTGSSKLSTKGNERIKACSMQKRFAQAIKPFVDQPVNGPSVYGKAGGRINKGITNKSRADLAKQTGKKAKNICQRDHCTALQLIVTNAAMCIAAEELEKADRGSEAQTDVLGVCDKALEMVLTPALRTRLHNERLSDQPESLRAVRREMLAIDDMASGKRKASSSLSFSSSSSGSSGSSKRAKRIENKPSGPVQADIRSFWKK